MGYHLCLFLTLLLASLTALSEASPIAVRSAYPNSPAGARLVQLKPCSSAATVPAFVNSNWAAPGHKSSASSVYISQHGAGTDFDYYFASVNNIVGKDAAVIAPAFYETNAAHSPSTWYDPASTLAWSTDPVTWAGGSDSVSPAGSACSSYSAYDDILRQVTDRSRFPNLRNIYWVGHSGGANMVQRWSTVASEPAGYHVRYIIANAAQQSFFSGARPNDFSLQACPSAESYPWQFANAHMPPYVSQRFSNADDAFRRWAQRDVAVLIGNYDTASRYASGMNTCETQVSGGANRRDRNYAAWAYAVLKAGAPRDVSGFTGYAKLKSQVKAVGGAAFHHQLCVADRVGHVGADMFNSACGRQALLGLTLTGSTAASYP
ncbi:unnamed protein product [Parajaminaea phylloscopi]